MSSGVTATSFWPPVNGDVTLELSKDSVRFNQLDIVILDSELSQFVLQTEVFQSISNLGLVASVTTQSSENSCILCCIDTARCAAKNGYSLSVDGSKENSVELIAADKSGIIYGLSTLLQLLKYHTDSSLSSGNPCITVPAVTVHDVPAIAQRSVMWSYRQQILMNDTASMKAQVELLSRMRMTMLFLVIDDPLDVGVESGATAEYLKYCLQASIEVIPTFVVNSIHARVPTDVLGVFGKASSICLILAHTYQSVAADMYTSSSVVVDASSVQASCSAACYVLMSTVSVTGCTQVYVATSEWTRSQTNPTMLAMNAGLRVSELDFDVVHPAALFNKPMACVHSFVDTLSTYVSTIIKDQDHLVVFPCFDESSIQLPVLLVKYYMILFAGCVWNATTTPSRLAALADVSSNPLRKLLFQHLFALPSSISSISGDPTTSCSELYKSTVESVLCGEVTNLVVLESSSKSTSISSSSSSAVSPVASVLASAEKLLWNVLVHGAGQDAVGMAAENTVPTKSEASSCVDLYRSILSQAKWRSKGGIYKNNSTTKAAHQLTASTSADVAIEEYLAQIHVMGAISRAVLLSHTGAESVAEVTASAGILYEMGSGVTGANEEEGTVERGRLASDGLTRKKRSAVCDIVDMSQPYVPKVYPKDAAVTAILANVVRSNILFRNYQADQHAAIVEGFESIRAEVGEELIRQGDDGEFFYIIQSGQVDIHMEANGVRIKVGRTLSTGDSFGELALMYNTPRAATVVCKEAGILWRMSRQTYRTIVTQHSKNTAKEFIELISNVKILGQRLGDRFSVNELSKVVSSLEVEAFEPGAVIVRQYLTGDYFYIITEGEVDVFQDKSNRGSIPFAQSTSSNALSSTASTRYSPINDILGDGAAAAADVEVDPVARRKSLSALYGKKLATLQRGDYFGEKALLADDVRQASCIAVGKVVCLSLSRDDFSAMLGSWDQGAEDGGGSGAEGGGGMGVSHIPDVNESQVRFTLELDLEELESLSVLGEGAFGKVKLVRHRTTGKEYALKAQAKGFIASQGMQKMVLNELRIMRMINHPCIAKLYCAMQDKKYIYFLLELLPGGEFFNFLQGAGKLTEEKTRFYSAAVVMALGELHRCKIAYRDLKPENMVLDAKGFVKLVDLGLAKQIMSGNTWTMCGTPDYLAPEIILNKGHDMAVDLWALGVLIYEMVHGWPPFYNDDPMKVYAKIISGKINYPDSFSTSMEDVIAKLCTKNPSKRLGNMKGGIADLVKHKWFGAFDWKGLRKGSIVPPFVPKVSPSSPGSSGGGPVDDPGEQDNVEDSDWVVDMA